jgi:hypothetical protein
MKHYVLLASLLAFAAPAFTADQAGAGENAKVLPYGGENAQPPFNTFDAERDNFQALDTDSDGYIEPEELTAGQWVQSSINKDFERLDTDGDDRLSKQEYTADIASTETAPDAPRP